MPTTTGRLHSLQKLPVIDAVEAAPRLADHRFGVIEVDAGGEVPAVCQQRNGAQVVIADDLGLLQLDHGLVKRGADGVELFRPREPHDADGAAPLKA